MAEIIPFRALHYNPEKIADLGAVVTQPYDKISVEMQAGYYERSPYNVVRIIRGRSKPDDAPGSNVYTRATAYLREWTQKQILVSETEPAIYPYYQEYEISGRPGNKKQRRGFIALGKLEDYDARVIHRHEETLSGPKVDRLELLKATHTHLGQIFMLYSDPSGSIEAAFAAAATGSAWEAVTDEYSTVHSVWRVSQPAAIRQIVESMRTKKLVIADGHHRYETALAYRNYCRAQGQADARADYVMMTFIRVETDGLTILPTHRVLHSLPNFDWTRVKSEAQRFFDWGEINLTGTPPEQAEQFRQKLELAGRARPTLGAFAGPGRAGLLSLRKDINLTGLLPDLPASVARLDVVILHRILLERVLGIDREAVREEKNLHYVRELGSALAMVESGKAQVSLVMNPTPIQAVWENALAGQVMPQKSTDFYPKLLTGLTLYSLDNPAGI